MAVLHELDLSAVSAESRESVIREILGRIFWAWYEENLDRKITTIRWWVLRKTLYVYDLHGVFELLFGPKQ